MILVDTSVWVDHLRLGNAALEQLLKQELVATHPFIIGELSCGNIRNRASVLADLEELQSVSVVDHDEVMHLVTHRGLSGIGIGWVDAHVLTSAVVSNCRIWSLDKALMRAAAELEINA
ncbi:MAG: PIN domain-containing protein [Candidatus Baltobacteraceae bacterium]